MDSGEGVAAKPFGLLVSRGAASRTTARRSALQRGAQAQRVGGRQPGGLAGRGQRLVLQAPAVGVDRDRDDRAERNARRGRDGGQRAGLQIGGQRARGAPGGQPRRGVGREEQVVGGDQTGVPGG